MKTKAVVVAEPNVMALEQIFSGNTEKTADGKTIIYHPEYIVRSEKFFSYLISNRDRKKAHVKTMYQSISRYGVLRDILVVFVQETQRYEIGDGQHLIEAMLLAGAKYFKFKLIRVEKEVDAFELVSVINVTQKRFSLADLIEGWSNYKDDYKEIIKFREQFSLTDRVLGSLLTGMNAKDAVDSIQRGEFKIINREQARRKILTIYDFQSFTDSKLGAYGTAGMLKLFEVVGFTEFNKSKKKFMVTAKELLTDRKLLNVPFGKTNSAFTFFKEVWQMVNPE